VPPAECSAANSLITHKPSGRTTTYGAVAQEAAKLDPPKDIKLKDPKDRKIAGKPLKRLDTEDKVNGKQVYAIDLKFPGMLTATIRDCPVPGGKVKSFEAAKVAGMRGVKKVVPVGDIAPGHRRAGFANADRRSAASWKARHPWRGEDQSRAPPLRATWL
jgi:isoquinoline 1-oxidoreductase beta subunit